MVFCSNCHCDIDESKMFLHQRFCIQNIKYCEQCQEGIIIEEYEEHIKDHKKESEKKSKSKELRDSLTLKRVESSKIGCQFCGYICCFDEVEEHEQMCGARSTKCKKCGKNMLIKDLKTHIEKMHNLDLDNYQLMQSTEFNLDKNQNSSSFDYQNLDNFGLQRMTSDEQIAYAIALSQEEEQKRKEKEDKKKEINDKKSENIQKNNSLKKQKSEKIDYDDLEYEYQKQIYEEEMKNVE